MVNEGLFIVGYTTLKYVNIGQAGPEILGDVWCTFRGFGRWCSFWTWWILGFHFRLWGTNAKPDPYTKINAGFSSDTGDPANPWCPPVGSIFSSWNITDELAIKVWQTHIDHHIFVCSLGRRSASQEWWGPFSEDPSDPGHCHSHRGEYLGVAIGTAKPKKNLKIWTDERYTPVNQHSYGNHHFS